MLKINEERIMNLFRKDIFLEVSIKGLANRLKKAYPKIHKSVKNLEKANIIKTKKIGKSNICQINLSPETISLLAFLEEQEAFLRKIPNIDKILEFKDFLDDIMLITGSYAKSKQTPSSDIDLVVITKTKAFNKQKLLENLTTLLIPEIHPIVLSYKDFISMLLSNDENYGKEIYRHRLLFRNTNRYYNLVMEAEKNGFRG